MEFIKWLKKKRLTKSLIKSGGKGQKGGSSQFLNMLYARGPHNTLVPNERALFKAFAPESYYVPNHVLRSGYATPQLAGLTSKFCK